MDSNVIRIGIDEKNPLIEILIPPIEQEREYKKLPSLDAISNIASVAAQAAPTLMIAKELANKTIMEVVIHGNLAKAADGNGLRAFSRASNGQFTEHARLYNTDSLSKIVNTAAVWQIASVVVAQKHLADINKKLENLQDGVNRISDFQQMERKSKIQAIFDSLKEKTELLAHLEPEQRKNFLNYSIISKYDDDLKQIYFHLKNEFSKYGSRKVEHKESFGTATLKADIENKINELNELNELAFICLNLRLICCHLIDHLGDINSIKEPIQQRILEELENFWTLTLKIKESIKEEICDMSSWVNEAEKVVKNNKGKIIASSIPFGLGPIGLGVAVLAGTVGSLVDKNSKDKLGSLELRKGDLTKMVNLFFIECSKKYDFTKELSNQRTQFLIEKEPPTILAFQKLDDQYLLCMNTGQKIRV